MGMKIKVKEGINLSRAIDELKASKPKLPFDVWYILSKIQSSLRPALESYELKYNELIDECAEKNEDGSNKMLSRNPPSIQMKDPDKFTKELTVLDDKMVPVKIEKIDKEEFKGIELEGSENMFTLFELVIK